MDDHTDDFPTHDGVTRDRQYAQPAAPDSIAARFAERLRHALDGAPGRGAFDMMTSLAALRAKRAFLSGTEPALDRAEAESDHVGQSRAQWERSAHGSYALHRSRWSSMVGVMLGALAIVAGYTLVRGRSGAREAAPTVTYATRDGQRADITLSDGSTVTLNVASRLGVAEVFRHGMRVVHLQGEASFHVAHAAGAPFVVEAAGVRTQVLGTEFAVRAYRPDDVQIVVRNGRVAVGSVVLGAHDIARTGWHRAVAVVRNQNVDAAFGFVTGRLTLTGVSLRDAIPDLDRWYAADVRLADSTLGNRRIYAIIRSGSITDLTRVLEVPLNVRIVRDGRIVMLYAK